MKLDCPVCGRTLRAPEAARGKQVKCPSCNHPFKLPPDEVVILDEAESDFSEIDDDEIAERDEIPVETVSRSRRRGLEPHRATVVLVMGILGLVVIPIIFGPIAWSMGTTDLRKMNEGSMDPEGKQLTNAGRICGMIGTILGLLCCGGYGLFILFAIMSGLEQQ